MVKLFSGCAAAVLLVAAFQGSAQVRGVEGCTQAPPSNEPPTYSDVRFETPKTTMLVVTIDSCGQATDVVLETSSGIESLDASALAAARSWHFGSTGETTKIRVPVEFKPRNEDTVDAGATTPTRQLLAQYEAVRVGNVPVAADGTLPGFIQDERPFGYASIAAAVDMLEREGQRLEGAPPYARFYDRVNGMLDVTDWLVFEAGSPFGPAILKRRLVSDGDKAFMVSSHLCEADPVTCERFEAHLRTMPRQSSMAPPPPPPAAQG